MRQETHFTEKPKEIYFENFSGTAPNKVWCAATSKSRLSPPRRAMPTPSTPQTRSISRLRTRWTRCRLTRIPTGSYGETWQPGVQDEGIMDNKELTEGFNSLQSRQLDL